MINIDTIKPQTKGESDKYSWNLYEYLRKNKGEHRILWDNADGKPLHPMNVYVLQGTIGRSLQAILWGASDNKYCFSMHPLDTYLDITDQFWDDYVRDGRCVFHSHTNAWIQGDEQRFTMIDDDTKECQWCGAVLRRHVEVVDRTVESWEVEQ